MPLQCSGATPLASASASRDLQDQGAKFVPQAGRVRYAISALLASQVLIAACAVWDFSRQIRAQIARRVLARTQTVAILAPPSTSAQAATV